MPYFVYMLSCSDGSLYVGLTSDYEKRIAEHADGIHPSAFTYLRRPVRLVYLVDFPTVHQAIAWERQIKRWSRKKKLALIGRQWDQLRKLAECRNVSHSQFKQIDVLGKLSLDSARDDEEKEG